MKKKNSLRTRLLISCIPLTVVIILVVLSVCIVNINSQVDKHVETSIISVTTANANTIQGWVGEIRYVLKTIKGTLENVKFANDKAEIEYLSTTLNIHKACPYGVYGGDASGVYLDASGWVPDSDYVVTERLWYKDGLNNKEMDFGAPYVDAQTGDMVVSASCKLNRLDRDNMVIAADIFLKPISEAVKKINVLNTKQGSSFIVDIKNSAIIAHKSKKYDGYEIKDNDKNKFFREIKKMYNKEDDKIFNIKVEGDKYMLCKKKIEGTSWVVFTTVPMAEIDAELRAIVVFLTAVTFVSIFVLIVIISRAMFSITKPIEKLTKDITCIADGDFTTNIEVNNKNDEIGIMSNVMIKYIEKMRGVIDNICRISKDLEINANNGNQTSEVLSCTAQEENTAIVEMQHNMSELTESMKELVNGANMLIDIVKLTNNAGQEANNRMNDTISITEEGHNDISDVQSNMKNIVEGMDELSVVVKQVKTSTDDIREMMKVIGEIAAQTNMLSLNASIEAARAGEAGRGFAIVAQEIGRLADDSRNTALNVNSVVEKITHQVNEMIDTMDNNVKTIENNVGAIDKACDTFDSIESNVRETSTALDSISDKMVNVDNVSDKMVGIVNTQSKVIDGVIVSLDKLTQDVEKFLKESKDVDENSKLVLDSSKELGENMNFFRV